VKGGHMLHEGQVVDILNEQPAGGGEGK
jgi:hypothetical protein